MENSFLAIFGKIWQKTMYYSTGSLARFLSNFKICKKSKYDRNQLKLETQLKYMYIHQKKLLKWRILS